MRSAPILASSGLSPRWDAMVSRNFSKSSDVFAGLRVESIGVLILLKDLTDDHRAVFAGIDRDLTGRIGQRLAHDLDAGLLVVVLGAKPLEVLGSTQQSDAAARNDTFFYRRTG